MNPKYATHQTVDNNDAGISDCEDSDLSQGAVEDLNPVGKILSDVYSWTCINAHFMVLCGSVIWRKEQRGVGGCLRQEERKMCILYSWQFGT